MQARLKNRNCLTFRFALTPTLGTAVEDYERLRAAVREVDIIGILGREIAKTAIDSAVTKQAIKAIRVLEPAQKEGAIRTLLEQENLRILSPVFVTVMRVLREVYEELEEETKGLVDQALVQLYEDQSHLLSVELNLSYYIQALGGRKVSRKEEILIELFQRESSALIRRQIILTMANWHCHYWLSDVKQHYGSFTEWEKRAFILGSYFLKTKANTGVIIQETLGRQWKS